MTRCVILLLILAICRPAATAQSLGRPEELRALLARLNTKPTDTARIITLLQLSEFYLFRSDFEGQNDSAEACLDRVMPLMAKYPAGPSRNRYNILKTYIDLDKGRITDAERRYEVLIESCRKQGDKVNEKFGLERLADIFEPGTGKDSVKLASLQRAISLSRELGDKEAEWINLCSMASVHMYQTRFDLSDRELSEVLNAARGREGSMPTALNLLSYSWFQRGQMDKAMQYASKARKYMEDTGDTLWCTNTYNLFYLYYSTMGDHEQGILWNKKCLDHCIGTRKTGIVYNICMAVTSEMSFLHRQEEALRFMQQQMERVPPPTIVAKLLAQKTLGNLYAQLKNYPMAETCYQDMIRYGRDAPNSYSADDRSNDLQTMGDFYVQRRQYARSKKFLDSALAGYLRTGRIDEVRNTRRSLYVADSALGNYFGAIGHLKESQRLQDTIFNIARNKQVEELNIVYQTAQKEKDLTISKEKQKITAIELHQARVGRNWIIASSIMLLLIAGLLVRQVWRKQKTNRIISHKNEALQRLVTEKEWLLKEVHHRVKNNLHTVICLLESQAFHLDNDALKAIETSQHRIYAMSMIHQKLYQSDDIRTIDMTSYLPDFIDYLRQSFGPPSNIRIQSYLQSIRLGVEQAVAVGLIINEAVTNAIKYAFPGDRQGTITIDLIQQDSIIQLTVADDGIGLRHDPMKTEALSLGLELIKGMARDLFGKVSFNVAQGTQITVRFPAASTVVA